MSSTERGTNTKGAMRAGGEMNKAHIISISRERIGIGRQTHPLETRGLTITTGKLLERIPAIHYHIITQFWVLTGEDIVFKHLWNTQNYQLPNHPCYLFRCLCTLDII